MSRLKLFNPEQARREQRARLVYLSPVSWRSMWQRPQELAARMARRFELCFCDPVGLRSARASDFGRLLNRGQGGGPSHEGSAALRPKYVPVMGVKPVDFMNKQWLRRQIRELVDVGDRPWILWIGAPSLLAETLLETARPDLVIYDCMDRYAAFHKPSVRPRIERAQQAIVERSDVVFTSSVTLRDELQQWNEHVVLAPNGADVSAFQVEPENPPPSWLADLKSPVIGFHGTLGDWLDYELLGRLADHNRDWTFAFIGPAPSQQAKALFARPNVRWHAEVPHAELPRHSTHFDAALVPFVQNELTRSVHPIKVLEYLALGLPVVATPLPDLQPLSGVLRLADTTDGWQRALGEAIQPIERSPLAMERRRVAVREQTWERREEQIMHELDAAFGRREHNLALRRARIFAPPAELETRAA